MIRLYAAAVEFQEFLQSQGWRFCIIGAMTLARWGEPRATRDVDVSLFAELGTEEDYIDALLQRFSSRVPDARSFALTSRVLLLEGSNQIPVDVLLASFPIEEGIIDRATSFEFQEGVELVTASAEDVFVLKSFAGRPQDWIDAESIAVRQGTALNWDFIREQLAMLGELVADSEMMTRVEEIRRRASADS
ncbi:MAG TPA: nucleotidyltransferase [Planctomycetaceae bacterium]|nr:nucleotidyltransferase [Planctomycetaceae bacterium]